tara:strand:- start:792 stop:1367 length:576 start_codon:yes stop_codon:yes gene_type:complete
MKINTFTSVFITITLFICNNVSAQEMTLDTKSSSIKWTGKEITTKSHYGSLKFKEGLLNIKNDNITNGKFIVDMNSIDCQDLSGSSKSNLEGHLKSDDFFSVNKYPEAVLTIQNTKEKTNGVISAEGQILVKGIVQPVTFDISIEGKNGSAKLILDRSKHNVRFRSGSFFQNLGDKLIYDDIEIEAQLTFK